MQSLLIVDDNVDILELLEDLLTSKGYNITLARSGESALLKMEDELPDLVLLDLDMPRMNGAEVCRTIRKTEHLKDLPVIIISGTIDDQIILEAKSAGCNDFISKPPDITELHAKIQELLGS